jgi:putative transposase
MLPRMGERGDTTIPVESRALERYRLIGPFLQGARTLASVAGQVDINLRAAQRWVDLYRKHGLGARIFR